jgi:hypothetical protein
MNIKIFLISIISISLVSIYSQQTVKGKVVDLESQFPLPGVNVQFINGDFSSGVATDINGNFKIENVPLGRKQLRFTFIGYTPHSQTIVVNSGKEVVINVSIEESTEMLEAFEISSNEKREVNNEMAIISAQQFSVEETERYAGSRGDPARMASNFAGVQGADDSRNDIIVRGNSPLGVIYRVEGITIPNPNHFAISGSSGGPLSILNNKFLGNSDFFSGAFPSEYGNSTAGVFDLKIRNGNNEKTEFTGQVGLFGAEFLMEGPISKNSSASYLIMYRRATLSMFNKLGINLGTSAIPNYQDFAAKINLPFKNGGNLSLWALGGNSDIDIRISEQTDADEIDLYGENTKDQNFGTNMMVSGFTYTKPLNETTFIKSTTCINIENQKSNHDTISRDPSNWNDVTLNPYMAYDFNKTRYSNSSSFNKKLNKKNTLKVGWVADFTSFDFLDSIATNASIQTYRKRFDSRGDYFQLQPYVSWKHKFSNDLVLTAGLTSLFINIEENSADKSVTNFSPIEPRLGLKWNVTDKSAFSFGLGYHSQTQPLYSRYYINEGNSSGHNENLDLTYSKHIVVGYSQKLNKNFGLKTEAYYQDLTGIPVETAPSAFSLTNAGSGFARVFPDTLVNSGTGYNYGLEVTLQRYFNKNWHALFSGCLYNSRYTASDNIERNTSFNGIYALNFLAGREFEIGVNKVLGVGLKLTSAGGKRYGIVNDSLSLLQGEVIFQDEGFNESQFQDYFRFDIKTTFKINQKKITHEIGVDLVNITNQSNILSLSYAPDNPNSINGIVKNNQLGFLPIFYYRIDF